MSPAEKAGAMSGAHPASPFFSTKRLTNHWARPARLPSYYWFLTFENQPELRQLARHCQSVLSFPFYDLTASDALHMTVERIAFEGEITNAQLAAVTSSAAEVCQSIAPIELTVGRLGGTPGAVGFSAYPPQPASDLRNALRAVTVTAFPAARLRPASFDPHVTIAYCNTDDIPAARAVEAVKSLQGHATSLRITEVSLVLLQRLPRAYAWQTITRLPLLGTDPSRPTTT
ncbi:2'-5' RNA ligase family protein [Catellatospora sp. NPDC049111]|uniref:2'-5' RNA ligase family protein n=1 Tax=Catellatospora sp. NPDC049111 TaxID=3155271 RepID=UPI0033D1346B